MSESEHSDLKVDVEKAVEHKVSVQEGTEVARANDGVNRETSMFGKVSYTFYAPTQGEREPGTPSRSSWMRGSWLRGCGRGQQKQLLTRLAQMWALVLYLDKFGVEVRGIERVPEDERHHSTPADAGFLWMRFSPLVMRVHS